MTQANARVVFYLIVIALGACAKGVAGTGDDPFGDYALVPDASSANDPASPIPAATADPLPPPTPDAPTKPVEDGAAASNELADARREGADAAGAIRDASPLHAADGSRFPIDAPSADSDGDARQDTRDSADEVAIVDAATGDSSDASPLSWSVSTASPGDLIITEIMFAPWGPEPQSEWFEVYNASDTPKLLSGLTIEDGYPRTHVVAVNPPVIAPPATYVVFVRDEAMAQVNGVPPAAIAYAYGAGLSSGEGIELENGTTGALSLWNGPTELARVPYGPWGMVSYGQSIELAALDFIGSDQVQNWCLAQNPWASGTDDGTPGAANDCP